MHYDVKQFKNKLRMFLSPELSWIHSDCKKQISLKNKLETLKIKVSGSTYIHLNLIMIINNTNVNDANIAY